VYANSHPYLSEKKQVNVGGWRTGGWRKLETPFWVELFYIRSDKVKRLP
jgi:predicted DNA-binding ribbon-helix-helix protein